MKRLFLSMCLITSFLFSSSLVTNATNNQPPIDSKEKLYDDTILNFLQPYIVEEIRKYYSEYFIYPPTVYQYHNEIVNIERFEWTTSIIKVRVASFFGPHISVGTDNLTFRVSPSCVELQQFEHIKSYKLPERYKDYIIDGYDNPPIP